MELDFGKCNYGGIFHPLFLKRIISFSGERVLKKVLFILIVTIAVLIQFQASQAAEKEIKEWTFLTFMNGHDSLLTKYVDHNLDLMKKVGSTDEINIVVQAASLGREETERVYVARNSIQVIEKLPRVDMGDYQELKKFIEWTVENYPAKKYFINVWNHGLGWHSTSFPAFSAHGAIQIQDVSIDSFTGNLITTEQMGEVMRYFADLTGNKVELYGNDACVMSMIEIAAEFKDSVAYFASSQENEPAAGWPYDKLLERWSKNPTMNGAEVGAILAEEYWNRYPDEFANPMGTTFSVMDVSELDNLMDVLGDLTQNILSLSAQELQRVYRIAGRTHKFGDGNDYRDLKDFVYMLSADQELNLDRGILNRFLESYDKFVIKNVTNELEEKAYGVSVWLPTFDFYYGKHINRYKGLEFNKKTSWADLLDAFFKE